MKIDIIIAYVQRYEFGHERDFVPPITGIHLAANAHRALWKKSFSKEPM
jgi:hypothetical protein